MKVIYIAGPLRSNAGDNGLFYNIVTALRVARILWSKGWMVFCPHGNSFMMGGPDMPERVFLDGDLEILKRCDAIYMMDGWESSEGATIEYSMAVELGMPIYYNMQDVPDGRIP